MKNQCINFFHYEEGHDLCFNITKSNAKNKAKWKAHWFILFPWRDVSFNPQNKVI